MAKTKQSLSDLFLNYENEVLLASGGINSNQKEAATRSALLKVLEAIDKRVNDLENESLNNKKHKLQLLER